MARRRPIPIALDDATIAAYDERAAQRGQRRSALMRQAIQAHVAVPEPPRERMTADELLGRLEDRARDGSVSAMSILARRLGVDRPAVSAETGDDGAERASILKLIAGDDRS